MTTKDQLHRLIDELPDSAPATAGRLLEPLRAGDDPVLRACLAALLDDEPLTVQDIAEIEKAKREVERGELITWVECKSRHGGQP